MKYLVFLFFSTFIYAQNIVSGNVLSENGFVLQNALVVNMKTGNKTFTNNEGGYKIEANLNDELQFIKENFEKGSKIIQNKDFSTPLSVQLARVPIEIEEVNVVARLTGDLGKDSKNHNSSEKVIALNNNIKEYIKVPLKEVQPKNSIPSSFAPRDPYAGQMKLLSITIRDSPGEIIESPAKEFFKKNKPKPSFSEIQNFYKKIKQTFYWKYFEDYGVDEFEFESYIIFLDKKYKLVEKYINNFNNFEIEKLLKNSVREYINIAMIREKQ